MEKGCLVRSKPKVLVVELPILKVIPIEARHLRLQVQIRSCPGFHIMLQFIVLKFEHFPVYALVFCTTEYTANTSVHHVPEEECNGCGIGV